MRRKRVLQSILAAVVLFSSTSYAQHVNSDKPLNCDSTCIIPDSRTTPLPKAQIARSPTIISQGPSRAQCGSAHQSVLPEPPSSFLCAPGMASNVATINDDGDITYRWTCGTALGTQTCQAKQRVTGACGLDHGRTLSSNPSNLCATGQSYGFNFNGNQYTWGCAGNYGSPAYCSATYQPPEPIVSRCNQYARNLSWYLHGFVVNNDQDSNVKNISRVVESSCNAIPAYEAQQLISENPSYGSWCMGVLGNPLPSWTTQQIVRTSQCYGTSYNFIFYN